MLAGRRHLNDLMPRLRLRHEHSREMGQYVLARVHLISSPANDGVRLGGA